MKCKSNLIFLHSQENCSVAGYGILKDTVVFINNYELNTSETYWDNPKEFNPDRFLELVPINQKNTSTPFSAPCSDEEDKPEPPASTIPSTMKVLQVKKNIPHFLPFSVGKRTCIGQNLVRGFSFLILANILKQYDVTTDDPSSIKMYEACVALPTKTYSLKITPREKF